MPRDLVGLSRARYDLLVVGGGIYGLFLAYEGASRGLSVALVERDDFGSGLSFNHQRTVHGGLRALERGDLVAARQQIAERRMWAVIAPHLVRPLAFLVGTYRFTKRSRLAIGAGFALYDRLGRQRNAGLPPALHLPGSALWSVARTRDVFPDIVARGLTGGAVWYDYQARHPDRLNWTVAQAAMQAGAVLTSYAEAVLPLVEAGRVVGARVRDTLDGSTCDIQARATVVAAGSSVGDVLRRFGADQATIPPLVRAANLVLDRPAPPMAIAAPGPSGRMLTAVPWQESMLVGTWQSSEPIASSTPQTAAAPALDALLTDVNATFPALQATIRDVRLIHHGLTPAVVRNGRADLLPASRLLAPDTGTRPGLFAVIGVKFTTARQTAEFVIDRIGRELNQSLQPSRTASTPLPYAVQPDGAAVLPQDASLRGLASPTRAPLLDWYGLEAANVAAFAVARGLTDPLDPGTRVIGGEIAYAAAHARATRLADAVLRRTGLGATGPPGQAALARAAEIMGAALHWTADRRAEEVARVLARYVTAPRRP